MIQPFVTLVLCYATALTPASLGTALVAERVRPIESFKHDIEVKLPNEQRYRTISIVGPRLCGRIRHCNADTNGSRARETTYNWYKIVAIGGDQATKRPLYFLTPATVLGRKRPEESDDDANNLLAISSNEKESPQKNNQPKQSAEFFLRPVMQRHHDEIYPINKPACTYRVCVDDDGSIKTGEIHTADQFGLHHAKRLSTKYLVEAVRDF